MDDRPEWWEWDLKFVDHAYDRMEERGLNEVEFRQMMDDAEGFRPDKDDGRWIVECRKDTKRWEIVVEPCRSDEVLFVITVYKVRVR